MISLDRRRTKRQASLFLNASAARSGSWKVSRKHVLLWLLTSKFRSWLQSRMGERQKEVELWAKQSCADGDDESTLAQPSDLSSERALRLATYLTARRDELTILSFISCPCIHTPRW